MEAEEFSPDHTDDGNDELDQSVSNSQEAKPDVNETDPASFVKQKADEKKGHKSKQAKEKPRSKKAAEVAAGPYIPGMSGTVKVRGADRYHRQYQ